jgi:sugar phosphate isomerase/epimerase
MKSAVTLSLMREARGGPFIFWDGLADGFARAEKLGFDAVELFPSSASQLNAGEIRDLCDRHRLKISGVGTGGGWVVHKLRLTDPDAKVRKLGLEFVISIIDAAAELGAPAIVGSMQGRWGDGPAPASREQALDWLATALEQLGGHAAKRGQVLLYEPLNRYETNLFNRAGEAAEFLNGRGIKGVKLLCDLFHMNIEETDIAAALRGVGPQLGHVHFVDSNRQAMGFGHIDPAPIAAALKAIGYGGYLSAEALPLPDSDTAARQSIAGFRKLVQLM